jgi:lantibiotic modifying enzyme
MRQQTIHSSSNKKSLTSVNMNALKADAFDLLKKADHLIVSASPTNDSLTTGSLGLVLYHYAAASVFGTAQDSSRAEGLVQNVLNRFNSLDTSLLKPSYARGLSGLGYTFNYLSNKKFIDFDMGTEFAGVDEFLFNQAILQVHAGNNDYLHGAFGTLFYFLSREKSVVMEDFINRIIDEVHANLNCHDDFFIRNEIIGGMKDKINFSLSHGQSGFMLILLQAIEAGYDIPRSMELVRKCIAFLLKNLQEPDTKKNACSFFPVSMQQQSQSVDCINRIAWCYGDLNQCLLLYRVAGVLDDDKYHTVADLVGLSSIMRVTPETTLCNDSHFCHGASGIAEMYRALYSLRPLQAYEDAYHMWVRKTIEFLKPELEKGAYINKETELLEGLVGPALTLLSFVSGRQLDWQRFFLLP